jgi:hypothetical protein
MRSLFRCLYLGIAIICHAVAASALGCAKSKEIAPVPPPEPQVRSTDDLVRLLGKRVSLTGTVVDGKYGLVLAPAWSTSGADTVLLRGGAPPALLGGQKVEVVGILGRTPPFDIRYPKRNMAATTTFADAGMPSPGEKREGDGIRSLPVQYPRPEGHYPGDFYLEDWREVP